MFICLAIIADDYFVEALEYVVVRYGVDENVYDTDAVVSLTFCFKVSGRQQWLSDPHFQN
jgi:hypothetical protein